MIKTEQINPNTSNIDKMSVIEVLKTFNREDKNAVLAVEAEIPQIAALIEDASPNFKTGGRLIYIGAGTSGRLGVLDASECPPTFGVEKDKVIGIIAGGDFALRNAVEGAEDSFEDGKRDLEKYNINSKDTVIGIAASGNTPYVCGALEYAGKVGAITGAISSNEKAKIFEYAKHKISIESGPEVISGSTRLKAGTAQKLVLNMISSTLMIALGKVYKNLMVDLKPLNKKLVKRSISLIVHVLKCNEEEAEKYFKEGKENVKTAIVCGAMKVSYEDAKRLLDEKDGFLSRVIGDEF